MAPSRRLPRALLLLLGALLGFAAPGGALARNDPPRLQRGRSHRGIAILASSLGKDVPAAEIEAFVKECRIDFVVFDFAWVTHHVPRTDFPTLDALSKRLQEAGVVTAAMYRPRALRPQDADVHFARDEQGGVPADHLDLCFAHADSVAWGASWGEMILGVCPSIRQVILYNVRAPCRCEDCAGAAGAKHAAAFVRECRERWREVRPDVLVGHVGTGTEFADEVDFLCPFAPLQRDEASRPVDAVRLAADAKALRAKVVGKPCVPLVKVCWESETRNTTEDVASAVEECGKAGTGFLLWYYEWILHPDGGRYDPEGVVRALGGSWDALRPVLARPAKAAAGAPDAWVYFDSRELDAGPRLRLSQPGGDREERAEADTVLISYLGSRAWGAHRQLGVTLGDTTRVLVRFPLGKVRGPTRADLVLHVHPSEMAPTAPFEVAVHAVEAAWEEGSATWDTMPAFRNEPVAIVRVEPRDGELRVDLTALVAEWAAGTRPNHGVLLKAAHPVAGAASPVAAAAGAEVLARALGLWDWAASPTDAVAQARASGRAVLAVVTASFDASTVNPHEELLLSTVLSHPAVVALGKERFVPVRVSYVPWRYTTGGGAGPDPLAPLGTAIPKARAPALVVASGEGKTLGTLEAMGTLDAGLVLRFLDGCLGRAEARPLGKGLDLLRGGRWAEAKAALEEARSAGGERSGESAYWLGALLLHEGEEGRGRALLEELAKRKDDPFSLKAALRLAFPERVALNEPLLEPTPATPKGEEAAIPRAVEYLLREQRPDGSWPVAEAGSSPFVPGVTVLAARALLAWRDDLAGAIRQRVDRALDLADGWIAAHVAKADAATLNSFAAAYHLDYALERHARGLAARGEVATAVRLLEGGACANGAWSYDRRFGEGWKGGFGGWPRTETGRTHSMNTGPALVALGRAAKAGFPVDRAVVAAGLKALLAMRVATGRYTYTWPTPRNFEERDSSVARAPVCEHALLLHGKSDAGKLRQTLDAFLERRADLWKATKLSSSWLPPHAYSAYFCCFAYHHAAEALAELGGAAARKDLAALRQDLLAAVEPDGSWVDDASIGKPYGTAAALLVLRRAGPKPGK